MAKTTKKPADSQSKPTGAASILAQFGGAEATTVHVFRRIEGGKLDFLRQYSEDEAANAHDRILTDHGPGYYTVQVKEGTRIVGSRQITVGDVSKLPSPLSGAAGTVAAIVPAKKRGGGGLLKVLMAQMLAQQQSMTQIVVAMIQGNKPSGTDPALVECIKLIAKGGGGGGLNDALQAIKIAQGLVPGGELGGDNESNAAAVVQTIAGTAEKVLPPLLELIMRKRDSGSPPTTAAAGVLPAAAPQNSPTSQGAASGAGVSTPPPKAPAKRMPFPGAQAIAADLLPLGAMIPEGTEITADAIDADTLGKLAQAAIDAIELHGGDMDDVLDWYPTVDGGLAQALIEYEPALQRAGKLLVAIDNAIRDVCGWKPEDDKGSTDQPA